MAENEIKEFVSKSIEQIKSSMPDGCSFDGKIDFDISVMTTKERGGKIGIQVVGLGYNSNTQQVHRIRFSIIDKKSQKEATHYAIEMIKKFMKEILEVAKKAESGKKITKNS